MAGQRKRVLYLIKGLGLGGAEKLLSLTADYSDRKRFEFEVVYFLPWKDALVQALQGAGITVYCLQQRSPWDIRALWRLIRILNSRRPDILHMHSPYAAIYGRIASRFARVPVTVYTEHNLFERYNRWSALAHRLTYRCTDAVICVSDAVKSSAVARCNVKDKPEMYTIHNGISYEDTLEAARGADSIRTEFNIQPGNRLVVNVASFTPKKRHVDLIAACERVLQIRPDVTFLLVGDGPLRGQIGEMVRRRRLGRSVLFAGTRMDAVRIIAAADLFVLPSLYEALGIAVLEAMAVGKPVLATRVGGLPEVIEDGVTGILVAPKASHELAEKMLLLLADDALLKKLGEGGRNRMITKFGIERMVRQTERVYDLALTAKGRSRPEAAEIQLVR